MATELRILSWCDACLEAGENTPGETVTVNVTGTPAFDVEVCPTHGGPLAAAIAALAPLGRGVGKGVPRTPSSLSETASRPGRPDDTSGPVDCPTCGKRRPSLAAMREHLRLEHGGTSLADVGLAAANHACPDCGSKYPNRQGLAAHRRGAHPGARKESA